MKDAPKDPAHGKSTAGLLSAAKILEGEEKNEEAARVYESIIKKHPLNEEAYNRLMIIYRKKRDYKKEKAVIDAGLKAFREFYRASSRLPAKKTIVSLSQALLKSTGLADRKGRLVYEREPLGRWMKRLKTVQQKLKWVYSINSRAAGRAAQPLNEIIALEVEAN